MWHLSSMTCHMLLLIIIDSTKQMWMHSNLYFWINQLILVTYLFNTYYPSIEYSVVESKSRNCHFIHYLLSLSTRFNYMIICCTLRTSSHYVHKSLSISHLNIQARSSKKSFLLNLNNESIPNHFVLYKGLWCLLEEGALTMLHAISLFDTSKLLTLYIRVHDLLKI
jgi:hypothetical protein